MIDSAQKRGQIVRHFEEAFAATNELSYELTGYLIECALDEARPRQFRRTTQDRLQ